VFEIAGGNPGGAHLDGLLDELNAPVFTTTQAKYLDAKVDDGLPLLGRVRSPSFLSGRGSCETTNTPSTALYDTSKAGPQCLLIWMNVF
jgi:hypothetical protein